MRLQKLGVPNQLQLSAVVRVRRPCGLGHVNVNGLGTTTPKKTKQTLHDVNAGGRAGTFNEHQSPGPTSTQGRRWDTALNSLTGAARH